MDMSNKRGWHGYALVAVDTATRQVYGELMMDRTVGNIIQAFGGLLDANRHAIYDEEDNKAPEVARHGSRGRLDTCHRMAGLLGRGRYQPALQE